MKILKTRIAATTLVLLIAASVYGASAVSRVKAERAATVWGVEIWMDEEEVAASSSVCAAIASYFSSASGYSNDSVANFYGEDTLVEDVLDYTSYCDSNFDFATVFYKGHSHYHFVYYGCPMAEFTSYFLYDNDESHIDDLNIALCTDDNEIHDFVFLWSCGTANEQGEIVAPGFFTVGMSAAWLTEDGLDEDTHDNPDYSDHCFISFRNASPYFIEDTGYNNYTLADFVTSFYQYATDGYHTIDQSLDKAADDCFGEDFEDTWLQNYLWYVDEPEDMQGGTTVLSVNSATEA